MDTVDKMISSYNAGCLYSIPWSDRLQSSRPDNTIYNSNVTNSSTYAREPEYYTNLNTIR